MIRRPGTTPPLNVKTLIMTCCCTLLALAALVAAPVSARAADTTDTWDGTADTSWYDTNPDAETFTLDSAEDLAGLAQLTNQDTPITFTGKTILLTTDVNLSGHGWTAISQNGRNSTETSFSGTFDGQGHTISNLKNVASAEYRYGLFGTVHKATIKDLNLVNAEVAVTQNSIRLEVGTIVSWSSDSIIENCSASGALTCETDILIGGLAGQCTGSSQLIGCHSAVDVISTYPEAEIGGNAPTVGGLVGQWENAGNAALIQDCAFSGSMQVTSNQAGCGGILGACFDFDGAPGVTINNCLVSTTAITCGEPDNITYIAAVDEDGAVTNCYWPDDERAAVVQLVVDWDQGTASADPDFDQTQCGSAIVGLSADELIDQLNTHATANPNGPTWCTGINGHPVLWYQTDQIPADYTEVDAAVDAVPGDLSSYTAASAQAVNEAVAAVDRTLTSDRQDEVDAMAQAINDAVAALEKLADCSALNAAIEKAVAIDRTPYTDDSLAALDQALEAARAGSTAGWGASRQSDIDALTAALDEALAALERKPETPQKPVDENKSTAKNKLPGTGDPALAALVSTTAAGAGALYLGTRLRKRQ